ncbi:aldo/keto reductase [Mycobacterium sp. DL]|uniref:Putative oxidoreductase n=1 Tax=Mycolicibacterium hippocampi TaxID=659824 RepID=A0A850PU68_9MYCO|nr:putative oxidoreductase [Mycolicibacterium hippocampi]
MAGDDNTARRVDRLGLGLAALGRPAYLTSGRDQDVGEHRSVDEMRSRTAEVLDAAYAGGIRYVDAARSYGRSEEFLSDWLNSRPDVTDVHVASKWGYRYVGRWRLDSPVHEVKEHTLDAFTTQWRESRGLLGDRLRIYQVHSVTEESPVLSDPDLQNALAGLRDSGISVGLSTSGPHQAAVVRAALAMNINGTPLFSVVQSTWNLLETSVASALAEAHAAGVAVVVKEVFANGRLAPGGTDPAAGVQKAARMATDLGVGIDQLAVAAAVSQPWSPRVLSGAVTVSQVQSHIAGADLVVPAEILDALSGLSEDPVQYWAARSRRPWA